jgi:hypothetical protein
VLKLGAAVAIFVYLYIGACGSLRSCSLCVNAPGCGCFL